MSGPPFTGIEAVLFDVLHTLVDDSGFPRFQLWKMLEAEGCDLDAADFEETYNSLTAREYDWEAAAVEDPFRTMKDRHKTRLKDLYRHFDLDRRRDLVSDIEMLWDRIATSGVYREVPDVLPILQGRGYRIALISNADIDDPVIRALYRAGIDVSFDAVVTSQEVGSYKPAARIFERALYELGLEPEEVVMVGDNPASDVMGAKRMGIAAVWVDRRGKDFPDGYPAPDARIRDLRGLLDFLQGTTSDGQ